MDAKTTIRESLKEVMILRNSLAPQSELSKALIEVKRFQAKRFNGTYSDLLHSASYSGAARFFLEELYGERDFSERDAQFARIAGAINRFFPEQVATTAVNLARLHALSEELDYEMALAWNSQRQTLDTMPAAKYANAWKMVGRFSDREMQVALALQIGKELDQLTRKPTLRIMLHMMRKPAQLGGLGALQTFLEKGFDTFAALGTEDKKTEIFMRTIHTRESQWLETLFTEDIETCQTRLQRCLTTDALPY
jgi:hypothetical protein